MGGRAVRCRARLGDERNLLPGCGRAQSGSAASRVARSSSAPVGKWRVMTSSVLRPVARHPVVTFMVIGLGAAFLVVVIPPIVDAQILPFDLPLYGVVGGVLGVGVGAFFVTYAVSGSAGVADLARRSVRWRVPLRWYLMALLAVPVGATLISLAIYGPDALATPPGGWPRALGEVAAFFVLQLVLFQLAEEIGFTGFLQHHWQDRYHPMKLTVYVALLWALWHLPDHFAEEGWGVEQLIAAPVVFAIGFVSLFFARALVGVVVQPDGQQCVVGGDLPRQF
jgi:uncharacterized protein